MLAGFDRGAVSSDLRIPAGRQLEMAELVHDAFENAHHAIVEVGRAREKRWAYLLRQFAADGRVVIPRRTKSLQETALPEDIPFFCRNTSRQSESGGDEGARNFLCISKLHRCKDQALLKAWRDGCIPADQGLGEMTRR